jgi:peptidoglycan/LPS O-acetylase OafA/YrhL
MKTSQFGTICPSADASKANRRFLFVDALRGIAALAVVLFHGVEGGHITALVTIIPRALSVVIENGALGVAIFFVLSGFVIAHSLYDEKMRWPLVGRFMLRRSIRLDPPYWCAIALTLAFAMLSARIVPGKSLLEFSYGQILAHVFYLQDILRYPNLNPVFWTLCLEVQFYLVYAALLTFSRNDPNKRLQGNYTAAVLCSACVLSLLWPMGVITSPLWPGGFLQLWHAFLLGTAAYWSWRNPILAPFFVVFALLVGGFAFFRGDTFSLASALTAGVLWVAAATRRIYTALGWRWLQFLGLISYSLYLTHNPITGAVFRVGYMLTGRNALLEAIWWLVSIGCCILVAAGLWWLVERPSIRIARTILFHRQVALSAPPLPRI